MSHNCTIEICPVHFRLNGKAMSEYGFPVIITYEGDYVISTDHFFIDMTHMSEEVRVSLMIAALEIGRRMLNGDESAVKDSRNLLVDYLDSRTTMYMVGKGTLGDILEMGDDYILDNSEECKHDPRDSEVTHDMYVAIAKLQGNVEI